MSYGSGAMTKLEYWILSGGLAGVSHESPARRRRSVTFDDQISGLTPPSIRPGHLRSLLLTLDRLTTGTKTDAGRPLHQLADALDKRGLIVLISDLLDDPPRVIDGLKHFRFRGSDVLVFHVLDQAELHVPVRASHALPRSRDWRGSLAAARTRSGSSTWRHSTRWSRRTAASCRLAGIDYQLVNTSQPLDAALLSYLACATNATRTSSCPWAFSRRSSWPASPPWRFRWHCHLMRRHADPVVPFGAMRLIKRTPVEQVRRRRLRELLLLALRCAALMLLALSFARPYFVSAQAQGLRAADGRRGGHVVQPVHAAANRACAPARERRRGRGAIRRTGRRSSPSTTSRRWRCLRRSIARRSGQRCRRHRAAAAGDSLRGGVVRGWRPIRQPRRTARDRDRPAAAWLGCGFTSRASIRCGG